MILGMTPDLSCSVHGLVSAVPIVCVFPVLHDRDNVETGSVVCFFNGKLVINRKLVTEDLQI